jgi:Skp family chaperone for outer membrane proteins
MALCVNGARIPSEHLIACMSDEVAPAVEPVAPPEPPAAAIAPNKPAVQSDDPAAVKAKLDLVLQDKQRLGETNSRLNQELLDLKAQLQTGKRQKLEESGEFKTLWEDAKKTVEALRAENSELKAELSKSQATIEQERIDMQALNQISAADAINPEQLQQLLRQKIKAQDGKPVALNGGVEQPLQDFLETLKQPGSGYEHHFRASGVKGMGVNPAIAGGVPAVPGSENPWITGNLTQQVLIESRDPATARTLQAEAQVFKSRK